LTFGCLSYNQEKSHDQENAFTFTCNESLDCAVKPAERLDFQFTSVANRLRDDIAVRWSFSDYSQMLCRRASPCGKAAGLPMNSGKAVLKSVESSKDAGMRDAANWSESARKK